MQGKKQFQPELFATINIESLVPKTHLLRKIDGILDLSFIHELTADRYCETNGRPSIDPEVFFRMCLVGYLYGIDSDRKLCEELQYNLAYRWFCRYSLSDSTPDHSSMTRIRDRLGKDVFEKIFNKVLSFCRKRGLLKNEGEILFDSSHIKADAALNSLVPKDASVDEIKNRPNLIRGSRFKNQTHVSCTDPDSSISGKVGIDKGLYYKVHSAVDTKSRVILDPFVTTGAIADGKVLLDRIEYLKEKREYEVNTITADRGYGYAENIKALHEKNIKTNIGTFHGDSGKPIEELEYNEVKDEYRCPKGKVLSLLSESKISNTRTYRFKEKTSPCKSCSIFTECKAKNKLKRLLYIKQHIDYRLFRKLYEQQQTTEFIEKLRERMWKIEGLFAEGKENHCLSRAKYRGLNKMQIQAYMIGITQNLKRLVAHASTDLLDFIYNVVVQFQNRKNLIFT